MIATDFGAKIGSSCSTIPLTITPPWDRSFADIARYLVSGRRVEILLGLSPGNYH